METRVISGRFVGIFFKCTSETNRLQQSITKLYKSERTSTKIYPIVQVWKHFNKYLPNCTSLKPLQQSITKLYKSETTSTKICPIVQVWKHLTKFYPIVQIWKHLYKDLPNCTSLKARQQRFTQLYKPETKWKSTCRHPREKIKVKFIHTYHPVWWRIKIWKILHMQNLI